jgi:hypothetical protein
MSEKRQRIWISRMLIFVRLVVVALLVVASGYVAFTTFEEHKFVLAGKQYLIDNRVEIEREYKETRPFEHTSMHASGLQTYKWRFENTVTIPSHRVYRKYVSAGLLLLAAVALMLVRETPRNNP